MTLDVQEVQSAIRQLERKNEEVGAEINRAETTAAEALELMRAAMSRFTLATETLASLKNELRTVTSSIEELRREARRLEN